MYFRPRIRTLGAIGKEDGTPQPAGVRQRGYVKPVATPAQIQTDLATATAARQEIAASLTPVSVTSTGTLIYAAPTVNDLPQGANPIGIRDGTIIYSYPVASAPSYQQPPDSGGKWFLPAAPSPDSPSVPTTPSAPTPESPPPAPSLSDGTGTTDQEATVPGSGTGAATTDPWADFLDWYKGANQPSSIMMPAATPTPQAAGSEAIEIIDQSTVPGWVWLALGAGVLYWFSQRGSRA